MAVMVCDWELGVERGPGWLIVRPMPHAADAREESSLADAVWSLLDQHFTYRVVLEMDQFGALSSHLIGQLILLHKRVRQHGGIVRLCGLSRTAEGALAISHLDTRLPSYRTREEAVLGSSLPAQPR